jgi:hypothetical protein
VWSDTAGSASKRAVAFREFFAVEITQWSKVIETAKIPRQ